MEPTSHPRTAPDAAAASRRRWSRLVYLAGALAAGALLLGLLSSFGTRLGLWDFRTGFTLLRWAAYLGVGALAAGAAGIIRVLLADGRRGAVLALVSLAIGLVVVLIPWQWSQTARGAPPIHDITTDMEDPPEFRFVLEDRADAPNPPEYAGEETAEQQREAYPHIVPLLTEEPPDVVFEAALRLVDDFGWEIAGRDAGTGRIEATARTFWFGFLDDVVIRVRPEGEGARVDVRSKSRVGRGDAGTNARRIESYLTALREALGE